MDSSRRLPVRPSAAAWRAPLPAAMVAMAAAMSAAAAPAPPPVGTPWAVATVPVSAGAPVAAATALRRDGPLSLAELCDFALRSNPSTRAAWALALADLAGVDAARALLRPTLDVNVPFTIARGGDAATAGGGSGTTRSASATLGLSWVLFDFGARAAGVQAARWQAAASQLAYNRELQTVVSTVEQAYYTLLGARRLQAALQTGVEAARASVEVAQARRKAGLATAGDTAQAEASLADARLQLAKAQAQARAAAGTLANAVGLPVNTALDVADDDTAGLAAGRATQAWRIDDLLATAKLSRADLIALNAQVQQGQAQLAATAAQGKPSLALSAQAARRWGSDGDTRSTQQVGLTLSIPLFDGGLVRAQTAAARARLQAVAAQRDLQRHSVELEVWQSFQDADSAQAVIDSAQALLRSASAAEGAARERYRAGVGSLLELLVAQSTAAQARVSLVQARYDAQLALARLGYAVGAGLPLAEATRHGR